jgi:hypothetical protein
MPSELAAFLAVTQEEAKSTGKVLYVVDDGTGEYWSTGNWAMVPITGAVEVVNPSGVIYSYGADDVEWLKGF